MEYLEVKATDFDTKVLTHLVRRNFAVGARFNHNLGDIILTYDAYEQVDNIKKFVESSSAMITRIIIKAKLLTLEKIIKLVRSTKNIDEKRAYLYDALMIEEQINELVYGDN